MLINPTHPTTKGGLPSSLLETYVRYKQGTRAIIAWLLKHGNKQYENLKTVSIRDLLRVTEIIRKQAILMPDIIDFQFRQTIAARAQLSEYFRKQEAPGLDDVQTTNHEYFTNCLTKIYTDLCECCSKPKELCEQARPDRVSNKKQDSLSNRFALLSDCPLCEDPGFVPVSAATECRSCISEGFAVGSTEERTPRLLDDDFADLFENCEELERMANLVLFSNKVWEKAGQGGITLVVAAFMTNAVLAAFEEIDQRLQIISSSVNPHDLKHKIQLARSNPCSHRSEAQEASSALREVEALQQPWLSLLKCKSEYAIQQSDGSGLPVQHPSQIIIKRGLDSSQADKECLDLLLQNISLQVRSIRRPTSIVRLGTPLYADIGYYLTHPRQFR